VVLDEQQLMIQQAARRYATEKLAPNARAWEAAGRVSQETLLELGAMGFMGMTVPESSGGAGLDYVSYVLALTEIAAGDGAVSTIMSVNNAPVCAILDALATPAQCDQFLRPLATGQMIGAFALTEPQAGSDAANMRTTAVRRNGGFVIRGVKQFITSGAIAGVTIVFAVTDAHAGKKGISAFLVPNDLPGVTVTAIESKMGQCASDTAQLTFDGVEIPEENLIGQIGHGYSIALANLEAGRIGIAAQAVGMAQAALEYAVSYCREREAFGSPLIKHQAVAFRLADAATQLEAARALVMQAAALKDAGRPCLQEACIAKLFSSEAAERIVSASLQCLGGYGYSRDYPLEKIARDVRVCQIYEGTSDIQRLLISRAL